jgi:predicted RNA-binding Zn ribbon-like protein
MTSTKAAATSGTPDHELWVEFVNTLSFTHDRPTEALPDSDALIAGLRRAGLLSERAASSERAALRDNPDEAARRMERFRALRDLLRGTASEIVESGAPDRETVRELNHVLRDGLHFHQLEVGSDGTTYGLARVGDRLDQARATIAGSLAGFVASGPTSRLRVCANEGCREVFIDRSRTGRRRWCDMRTCGNQAKAARHRARIRRAVTSGALPASGPAH